MLALKVVCICHFSNEEVREHIITSPGWLQLFVRRLFGKSNENFKGSDFAPWINNLIKEFEQIDNVEFHIVAPIPALSVDILEFEIRKIHYHFFRGNLTFPYEHIISKVLGANRRYSHNKKLVKKIINKVNPDIINLIGSENPYYSSTILGVKDIPIFVSAQTVYTNPDRLRLFGSVDQLIWNTELKILNKEKYFGCASRMHRDLILHKNPNAIIFKMFFPIQYPNNVLNDEKIYDFISFSQSVCANKGANDAIEALFIVKQKYPKVQLNIVGNFVPESNYGKQLLHRIKELSLNDNVSFSPYFSKHSDMHQHTQKSKFALLPVKLDVISGSIIEAILLDLPLVTYKTTGTPFLNKDSDCVLISEIGDIDALAANMIKLMDSPELANSLKNNAKEFVYNTFNNTKSAKRLLADYIAVIEHFHYGTQIPNELLFNTEEFPIYD